MREIIPIPLTEIEPERPSVLRSQGIGPGIQIPDRINGLVDTAFDLFRELAEPVGIMTDISPSQFAAVYNGSGGNEPEAPLYHIFPRADHLALFALTLGQKVSRKIEKLFAENDFALGAMLDAAASVGADRGGTFAESRFRESLLKRQKEAPSGGATAVLLYSPGYCGWHISSQQKLFKYLHPEEIGIRLNDSFLMTPLKSISGVLVAGAPRIHIFQNNYSFCRECRTRSCLARINRIKINQTEA
jgi:hypothetical protein